MSTVKLTLKNFKCWRNKIFEIPLTGLTLLSGDSGVGKSTILQSIYWVLYGELKKITSYGEKTSTVILQHHNITIKRTKTPNSLKVTIDDREYSDVEAQCIINKKYGTQFLLTSYITQKGINNFLNLSNSDKMEKLQELAFSNIQQITQMREKLNDTKKLLKTEMVSLTGESKVLTDELTNLKLPELPTITKPLYDTSKLKKLIKKSNDKAEISNFKISDYTNKQNVNNNNIQLQNQFNEMLIDKTSKLNSLLSQVNGINIEDISDELNQLTNQYNYIKFNTEYIKIKTKYTEEKTRYDSNIKTEQGDKTSEISKLKGLLSSKTYVSPIDIKTIKQQIDDNKTYKKIKKELNTKTQKLNQYTEEIADVDTEEIDNEITELNEKLNSLQLSKKIRKCPKCSCSLIIKDDKLKLVDTKVEDNINDSESVIKTQIAKLTECKKTYDKAVINIDMLNTEITELQAQLKRHTYREIPEGELDRLTELHDEYKNIQTQLTILEKNLNTSRFDNDKTNINKLLVKMNELESKIDNNTKIPEQDINEISEQINLLNIQKNNYGQLQDDIQDLQTDIKNIQTKINKIIILNINYNKKIKLHKNKIQKYKLDISGYNTDIESNNIYDEYNRELINYNNWKNKLDIVNYKIFNKNEDINSIDIILKKISEAESLTITETIDNINYYLNFYLEKFFDNAINIQLVSFKEQKNGIVKPNINLKISYKGNIVELEELSGGELDRVILCIFLSLNTINGNDFLLLDESLSSLQGDLANDIIDVLKENIIGKTVLIVSHQCCCGIFDNILNVKADVV